MTFNRSRGFFFCSRSGLVDLLTFFSFSKDGGRWLNQLMAGFFSRAPVNFTLMISHSWWGSMNRVRSGKGIVRSDALSCCLFWQRDCLKGQGKPRWVEGQ